MAVTLNFAFYLFLHLTWKLTASEDLCNDNFNCVPLSQCGPVPDGTIVYPCHSGLNLICCPSASAKNDTKLDSRKKSLFPVECGVVQSENKITGGQTADLGQFPWMALLGYRQKNVDFTEFLCGGTVITEKYVMTAAHCLNVEGGRELVVVRLGEHNLQKKRDCIMVNGNEDCADSPIDIPVKIHLQHPQFNFKTLKNDIALVKLKNTIKFSGYIQPICLPFERNLENKELTGQKFTISGWGKTDARKLGGSSVLQFATVYVWDLKKCNNAVPPEVRDLSEAQLCANGKKKEDACKGDSGGPLSNATTDLDGMIRNFQIGIVSFASSMTCGIEELPPIYTRVDKYLKWILDNVS